MTDKELAEIRQMHEDYIRFEGAIHGGTGTGLQMCYSYQDGHDEFCEWLIDGFGGFIDDIAQLQADNSRLAASLAAAERDILHDCWHCKDSTNELKMCPKGEGLTTLHLCCPYWQWRGTVQQEAPREEEKG